MVSRVLLVVRATIRRIVSDRAVVAAALATVLLSTTLLSTGPIYAEAVTISAFDRAMDNAPPADAALSTSARVFPEDFDAVDRILREEVAAAVRPTTASITAILRASAHQIDLPQDDGEVGLAALWNVEGIEELATLETGRWPNENGNGSVAVPSGVAEALGISVGDRISLTRRGGDAEAIVVEVVGRFTIDDPSDVVWFSDPLVAEGTNVTGGFEIYGPFVTSRRMVLENLRGPRVETNWRISPEFGELRSGDLARFRAAISGLETDLNERIATAEDVTNPDATTFDVVTNLPDQLSTVSRSISVTRSTVLAVLLQLSLLAAYALVLTSRLIVDTRTTETALVRSRGGSPGQLTLAAGIEGLVLVVPAALLGPPLASFLLRGLNQLGPLASIGLTVDPRPNPAAYLLAGAAALLALLTLAWPAYRAARAFPDPERRGRRQTGRSATQRLGIDVALVALVVIAVWQLGELGPRVSATVRGRFGIDPLLVVAPVLGLVAGVVLALRIVPSLARLSERLVSSRIPVVPALALWQVARRPARYARSALLLMMAVALGVFASSFSSSWLQSQVDQANFRVGADLKFTTSNAPDTLTNLHMRDGLESLPGVVGALPVHQIRGAVGPNRQARIVLADARAMEAVVRLRPDLDRDFGMLMSRLVEERIGLHSLQLPGEPVGIGMVWEAQELPHPDMPDEEVLPCPFDVVEPHIQGCFYGVIDLVLEDGDGMLHRVRAGEVISGHGPTPIEVDLIGPGGETPRYPISVVAIEVESPLGPINPFEEDVPPVQPRPAILSLRSAKVTDASGSSTTLPITRSELAVGAHETTESAVFIRPQVGLEDTDEPGIAIGVISGVGFGPFITLITPTGPPLTNIFPVVTTQDLVDEGLWEVGTVVSLRALGLGVSRGEIVGTIPAFPGLDPVPSLVIVVDLPTYQALRYQPGGLIQRPQQYWLATEKVDPETVAALSLPPFRGRGIVDRDAIVADLTSDPIALGTVGAFAIGFVAAAVFAVIGFTISGLVSARERSTEFSLLHALGLGRGQLGSWLALEQAALVMLGLGLGTLIGLGIGELLLPLVTLNQDGSPTVPELLVVHPWITIAGFEIALVAVLAAAVALLIATVRGRDLGAGLRFGDEP